MTNQTQLPLPQNVQEFIQSESGAHLFLMLLENSIGGAFSKFKPEEQVRFEREYGCESSVEMDLELLLNHLSRIRVVADLNSHAEDCLISYWNSKDSNIFLVDARRYVMDALRIAPREHPELAKAHVNLAHLLLARDKVQSAMEQISKGMCIFQKSGMVEQIVQLMKMVMSRTEPECERMRETLTVVLKELDVVVT